MDRQSFVTERLGILPGRRQCPEPRQTRAYREANISIFPKLESSAAEGGEVFRSKGPGVFAGTPAEAGEP